MGKVELALVKQGDMYSGGNRATGYGNHNRCSPDDLSGSEVICGGAGSVLVEEPYKNSSSSESLLATRQSPENRI